MTPITHLLASWIIGAKATDNARDCRLVALAGVLPDADGLGLIRDIAGPAFGWQPTNWYQNYHHYVLHGAFGAMVIALLFTIFARRKLRVALLCLVVVHLHILCDIVGSRGPGPEDLWPIFYFGPFSRNPMWMWHGQWALDAWPNRVLTVVLFVWALWMAPQLGHSFVGVFNRRLDRRFVEVLRKWHWQLTARWRARRAPRPARL